MLKRNKWMGVVLLAIAAAAYFAAYSDLESNLLLKGGLVILPIQVSACIWLLYRYGRRIWQ